MSGPKLVSVKNMASLRGEVSESEWDARVTLAAAFRVATHLGWNFGIRNHMTLRLPDNPNHFLMNASYYGWHEITASNLLKVDLDGNILSDTDKTPGPAGLNFHSAILRAKPELNATLHLHPMVGVAVSATEGGLQYYDQGGCTLYGELTYHAFEGLAEEHEEAPRIVAELGDKHAMIMHNHGLLTVGRTFAEGFLFMATLINACELQMRLLSMNAKPMPVSKEVLEFTRKQFAKRYDGKPRGDQEWAMYYRYAEQIDLSFKT